MADPRLADADVAVRELPSGRTLVVTERHDGDVVEIHAPGGGAEVTIVLTEDGPRVTVRGGRLEMATPEEIDLSCGRLRFAARDEIELSAHEIRGWASGGDVDLRGRFIRLNSPPEEEAKGS